MIEVAFIGFGAIGRSLARTLKSHTDAVKVVAVLLRTPLSAAARAELPDGARAVATLGELLALRPAVVVECAGHDALRDHGAHVLAHGTDLVVASVGALAAAPVESALNAAAAAGSARILFPSGALGALDILGAAKLAGLARVTYSGRKPVQAWRNTAAERMVNLDALREPGTFFERSAREAALQFPQNANVAAAVALAGLGFDATQVKLIADPDATSNLHRIDAEGAFGSFEFGVTGRVHADNPKTSMLVAFSIAKTLLSLRARMAFL